MGSTLGPTRRPRGSGKPASRVRPLGASPALVGSEAQIQEAYWKYLSYIKTSLGTSFQDHSYHTPNGIWIPGDPKSSAKIINSLRKKGFRKGVSDITIAWPVAPYHGAYIELKRADWKRFKEGEEDDQYSWLCRMRASGYYADICAGLDQAIASTQAYIAGKESLHFPHHLT